MLALHDTGMEFKLRPHRSTASRAKLLAEHRQLTSQALDVWLWLESRRLERSFSSARDYALSGANKCPETSAWRNWAVNWRTFGLGGLVDSRVFHYPRERLFNALALLLWEPTATSDPSLRRVLRDELRTSVRTPTQLATAYERLWERFR